MKTLKRHLTIALLLFAMTISAQGRKEKFEQVKSLKVAFITNELELTPDEAAKFWPIYNEFDSRQHSLRKKMAASLIRRKDARSLDNLTEKEAVAILSEIEKTENEIHTSRRNLSEKLRSVISQVKILKLKKAEDEFSRRLLKQYRQKRK